MELSSGAKYSLFVGIDVAAKTVSAAFTDGTRSPSRSLSYNQTPAGYGALQEQLVATGHVPENTLVVMEATGTYWVTLAITLVEAGYRVSVINAAQAYAFAKALLKRAKTDAIDAQTLAHLAAKLQPEPLTTASSSLHATPPAIGASRCTRDGAHGAIQSTPRPRAASGRCRECATTIGTLD